MVGCPPWYSRSCTKVQVHCHERALYFNSTFKYTVGDRFWHRGFTHSTRSTAPSPSVNCTHQTLEGRGGGEWGDNTTLNLVWIAKPSFFVEKHAKCLDQEGECGRRRAWVGVRQSPLNALGGMGMSMGMGVVFENRRGLSLAVGT